MRILIVSAFALATLAGCSSSGSQAPSSTDTAPALSAEDTAPPAATGYDAMTCAEWLTSDAGDQQTAAANFAAEYNDPKPDADVASIVSIMSSIAAVYGG